ncbi:hypothetical protein A2U01_0075862 [Trifolium medium]|uniref:Uncharacterized protein n=1 Tax=Trifolium medium TaxID=97028 RepID=A0A392T1H2_9FABA|nr:hypothetical protein [Trifolium medium]
MATLRVAPALAARRAKGRRLNRLNTHNKARRARASCAPRRNLKVPLHLDFSMEQCTISSK